MQSQSYSKIRGGRGHKKKAKTKKAKRRTEGGKGEEVRGWRKGRSERDNRREDEGLKR